MDSSESLQQTFQNIVKAEETAECSWINCDIVKKEAKNQKLKKLKKLHWVSNANS